MTNLLKKNLSCLLLLLPALSLQAQTFRHRAPLSVPPSDGFYSITVSPELSGYLGTALNDVRVMDGRQQVPFIIRNASAAIINRFRDTLHVVERTVSDTGLSFLVFANPAGNTLHECTLLIGSADAERTAMITGSNDGRRWFSVAEKVPIAPQPSGTHNSYEQTLNLPAGNYRFYKVAIDNGRNAPLNIEAVYRSSAQSRAGRAGMQVNEVAAVFLQKDSTDHYTYIRVQNPHRYHIEQVSLELTGPKYYKRPLILANSNGEQEFELGLGTAPVFTMQAFNDSAWQIRIFNGDNPPLKIRTVSTTQATRQLLAYLEGGKQYFLLLTAPDAAAPQYELQGFRDSIPDIVPELTVGRVTEAPATPITARGDQPGNKLWIWISLVTVLAILGFFTMRLVKDMKEEHSSK